MKVRKKGLLGSMLAVVLMLGALLGACGTDQPTGVAVQTVSGVVTVGTPTVGLKTCTSCHTSQTSDWMLTKHANVEPLGNLYSAGSPTLGQISTCTKNCHDSNGDGAGNSFTANYTGNVARPVVGCESCHGGGSLHVAAGGAGPIGVAAYPAGVISGTTSSVQVSAQFATCTSCHELLDPNDPLSSPTQTPVHSAASGTDPTGTQYTITDTHFAKAGIYDGGGHNLSGTEPVGYAMNFASETVCTNCHNPHKTADINREWAASLHANRNSTGPWGAYNWSCEDGPCLFPSPATPLPGFGSRAQCQRCHTTTGFASYADALRNNNAALADGIAMGSSPAIAYDPQFKPQMLECAGCHTDNRGTVRNPGSFRATYTLPVNNWPASPIIPTAAQITYQYPDIGASNVCLPCHTGRGSGRTIHALNTGQTTTEDFGSLFDTFGFPLGYMLVDGHYLTAGGTMFRGIGYEYYGRSYSDPLSFKHKEIGTASVPNTGTSGPCVGCHMYRPGLPANHLFQPVTKDGTTITAVSSEICFNCHAGSSTGLAEVLEQEKIKYEDSLQALSQSLLESSPSFSFGAFPYFNYTNWLSTGDTDWTGNTTGKNNIGAASNMAMLSHEEGGYVHNSRYVKRLIYDSIDWIDDNAMNNSVGNTIDGQCGAAPYAFGWCAGAKSYLLYGAPNTPGERP
jgi:Cytochrome c554 and c-prime